MRMAHALTTLLVELALVELALVGCARAPVCEPRAGTELDYTRAESWVCRPDKADDDDACKSDIPTVEVRADGTRVAVPRVIADDPPFDCFYVYPTLDVRLRAGVHDDFRDTFPYEEVVRAQFARFAEVCRTFAPLYRQVTVGTYVAEPDEVSACFDVAYADVERAFDHYLEAFAGDRGIVLVGHSQGGQILSRLLRERFDVDEALRARLIGAFPAGWAVGVAEGELVGGSSATVPVCSRDDEAGCMVGFRSYAEGQAFPAPLPKFAEGDEQVCVHPAGPGSLEALPLAGAYVRIDGLLGEAPDGVDPAVTSYVLYRDFYRAACVENDGASALEVRVAPADGDVREGVVPFDDRIFSGKNGTHLIDLHLFQGDLIARAARMAEVYAAQSGAAQAGAATSEGSGEP